MKIYLTHCSAKKDGSLRNTHKQITPDKLYAAKPTQRFMNRCKNQNVNWAILSDKYGVWFPHEKHEWYEKNPDTVTQKEFDKLVEDFENNVSSFLGMKYGIGLNSCTDALIFSLKAAGIKNGDEVITVSHTFFATIEAIHHCGATPILIDVKDDFIINPEKTSINTCFIYCL